MRYILFLLLLTACDLYEIDDYQVDHSAAGAPAIQKIQTGVGVVSEALTGTSYTKDRIKQRYGSLYTWTETSTLNGKSKCKDLQVEYQTNQATSLQYKVWLKEKAEPTPFSNGGCLVYGTPTVYVYYETIRCPTPSGSVGPCWQVESGNPGLAAEPDGEGAGVGGDLLASCSNASYCAKQKSFVNSASGASWSWSGTCAPSTTWLGTASGGRTGTAIGQSNIAHRQFALSQQWTAIVHCTCPSTNNPSCSF